MRGQQLFRCLCACAGLHRLDLREDGRRCHRGREDDRVSRRHGHDVRAALDFLCVVLPPERVPRALGGDLAAGGEEREEVPTKI